MGLLRLILVATERLVATALLVTLLGISACTVSRSQLAACNSYLQTFGDTRATWKARTTPPTQQMVAAVSRLSRDFAEYQFLKDVDVVWYENAAGELGVCTIAECPRAFFVYARDGLDKQPIKHRISASCGPL